MTIMTLFNEKKQLNYWKKCPKSFSNSFSIELMINLLYKKKKQLEVAGWSVVPYRNPVDPTQQWPK